MYEYYISAKKEKKKKDTWIFTQNKDRERKSSYSKAPPQGEGKAHRIKQYYVA